MEGKLVHEPAMDCLPRITERTREVSAVVEMVRGLRHIGLVQVFDWASRRGELRFAGRASVEFSREVFAAKEEGSASPALDCEHNCFVLPALQGAAARTDRDARSQNEVTMGQGGTHRAIPTRVRTLTYNENGELGATRRAQQHCTRSRNRDRFL